MQMKTRKVSTVPVSHLSRGKDKGHDADESACDSKMMVRMIHGVAVCGVGLWRKYRGNGHNNT